MCESNAVLKKGTTIKIFSRPFTVLEDVKLDATQEYLDKILHDQKSFDCKINGINRLDFKDAS